MFLSTILISKVNSTFMSNFNFKIYLKLNFKFISISISVENQFKFFFIPVFYFEATSKGFLFYFLFYKFNLSMWLIGTNTNLVHVSFQTFMSAVNHWKFRTPNSAYNTWPIEASQTQCAVFCSPSLSFIYFQSKSVMFAVFCVTA